jgi:hypothetical protein
MRVIERLLNVLIVAAVCGGAAAGESPPVAGLSWLQGTWTAEDGPLQMEEVWLAPKGGALLGMHRDVAGGKMVSFEFLRVAAGADGKLVYWASPRSRPPVPFTLKESSEKRVVFENLEHDFPQRILYWLDAEDHLHARVEGPKDATEKAQEWVFLRAAR